MNNKLCDFMNNIKDDIIADFENKISEILNVFQSTDTFIRRYDKNIYAEILNLCEITSKSPEQFFKIYFNSQIDDLNSYLENYLDIESRPKMNFEDGNIYFSLLFENKELVLIDLKNRLFIDNFKCLKDKEIKNIKDELNDLQKKKNYFIEIIKNPQFKNLKKEFNIKDILLKKNECIHLLENKIIDINLNIEELNLNLIDINNTLSKEEFKYIQLQNDLFNLGLGLK